MKNFHIILKVTSMFLLFALVSCQDYSEETIIDLSEKRILFIPKSVFSNPEIKKELYIGFHNYTMYPPMSLLPQGKTPLFRIPENLGNLTELEILSISSTQIKSLPKSISKLQKLRHLNLSFNKKLDLEKEIPNIIQLPNLDTLVIYGLSLSSESREKLKFKNKKIHIMDERSLF